jgi:hypothetical protein
MKTEEIKSKSPAPAGQRLSELQGKDTKHLSDFQRVFGAFFSTPRTMMEVTISTGIPTQYICWYVGSLRKKDEIQIAGYGRCPITGENDVQFLTTNPALFRKIPKQLNLFDNE